MEWIIPEECNPLHNQPGYFNNKTNRRFLRDFKDLFKGKNVLDLACHNGISSELIYSYGANSVVGMDIRKDLIESARENSRNKNIFYFHNDITNSALVSALVKESNIVTCFGGFYHVTNNFDFLECICGENIEYVIIETCFGTESPNAFVFPLFEDVSLKLNGWHPKYAKVPVYQPNLSWIYQALLQIGFKIDYIEKSYSRTDWDNITDFESNKRMIIKMYNPKIVAKKDFLEFDDIWQWDNDKLIHQC